MRMNRVWSFFVPWLLLLYLFVPVASATESNRNSDSECGAEELQLLLNEHDVFDRGNWEKFRGCGPDANLIFEYVNYINDFADYNGQLSSISSYLMLEIIKGQNSSENFALFSRLNEKYNMFSEDEMIFSVVLYSYLKKHRDEIIAQNMSRKYIKSIRLLATKFRTGPQSLYFGVLKRHAYHNLIIEERDFWRAKLGGDTCANTGKKCFDLIEKHIRSLPDFEEDAYDKLIDQIGCKIHIDKGDFLQEYVLCQQ